MAKGLCVLVHGFTGSPEELTPLADILMQYGYDVEVPVLCGHCGTKSDLETATASAWIHSVEPLVREGLDKGPVHLIGFSMGAMIAAIVASEYPVASLTMISPAVFYVGSRQLFRQIAGVIKETWEQGTQASTFLKRRIENVSQTPLRSVKQFRRLVQMGKSALPELHTPLCVIQGKLDEVVDPRGASFVMQTVPSTDKSLHWLPKSGHMACYGPEMDKLSGVVTSFLDSHPAFTSESTDTQYSDKEPAGKSAHA